LFKNSKDKEKKSKYDQIAESMTEIGKITKLKAKDNLFMQKELLTE